MFQKHVFVPYIQDCLPPRWELPAADQFVVTHPGYYAANLQHTHTFDRDEYCDNAALQMGIVGLPNVGKSSLFNLLTSQAIAAENYPFCTIDPNEVRTHQWPSITDQ